MEQTATLTYETLQPIVESVTSYITPAGVIAIIGGIVAAGIGFVGLWWGARKGLGAIKNAVFKGKLSV